MDVMRFQVLMLASMKMAVIWVVAPCSLVEIYHHFRGDSDHPDDGDRSTSETSVNYQATHCNNPEDGHLEEWVSFT
jgi:hypothetical protein